MSQKFRKNGSPTSNPSLTSGVGGGTAAGGSVGSGIGSGGSLLGRLLPMKATVPFQLKPPAQPPLQTRSVHTGGSRGNSPTHNNGTGKCLSGGYEATSVRTSASHSRSPTRAVLSGVSSLPPSSTPTCTPHPNTVSVATSLSASSRSSSSPTVTPYVSASGLAGPPVKQPQTHSFPADASSHLNVQHSNVCVNPGLTVPPYPVSGSPPCCSPSQQQLQWFSESSMLTASAPQVSSFSASPSSSSSSSSSLSSGGHRGKPLPPSLQWSPEHDRVSPERFSPSSPVCKERCKLPVSSSVSSAGGTSGSGYIHRTSSLDALTGPYLSGHWPRDGNLVPSSPCMWDKATQTPSAWTDDCLEKKNSSHKRSASWSSNDQLKEIAKLRQQLQRSKHSSRQHRDKDRKSPFNGHHPPINQSQAPTPKSALIPIPISKSSVSRFRNSVEGLNQEIERIIIKDSGNDMLIPQDVPDGHRAPLPVSSHSASSHCVDTQTPSAGTNSDSSSRSQSVSPSSLGLNGESPLPAHDSLTDNQERDQASGSPFPKYASSPKPNNSYMFKREPPEGCERVKVFEETQVKLLQEVPLFLSPDKNKVNFIPKSSSAFCPVNILKPLLPAPELTLKSPGQDLGPLESLHTNPVPPETWCNQRARAYP
ncbi:protein FAM117B [Chanos chanos]|uniref:Protein FAM117B n=1 Tax=Chanos chanos TaxID=29144 RepID=A0A6J2WGE7_CHACN|nr:protein FAM117B-like [Chanos chanos]